MSKQKSVFCYEESSNTIRMHPEGYLVAHRPEHCGWVCDPDAAVPMKLKLKCFQAIHSDHNVRWGSGLNLLAAITPTESYIYSNEYEKQTRTAKQVVKEMVFTGLIILSEKGSFLHEIRNYKKDIAEKNLLCLSQR